MKKQMLNVGKVLKNEEQKEIFGGNKGFGDVCTNPSGNACDPYAGQYHGNPACNINEVCVPGPSVLGGVCVCPD